MGCMQAVGRVSWQWPGFVMPGRGARTCAPTLNGRQRCMTDTPSHPGASRRPSPSGRGLGEGETPYAAQPPSAADRPAPPPFILRQAQDERLPTRQCRPSPVIPAPSRHSRESGNPPPPSPITPAPPPSFRRRPESRTPVYAALTQGPGVDSRFRGNDGGAGRDYGMNGGNDDGRGLPGFWIPAYAGMTVGAGGNDGMAGGNDGGRARYMDGLQLCRNR